MDAIIISDGADNPSKQILEQPSRMVPENHDVTDGVEGEWQIPLLGALPKPTPGFRNRDFRNPQTGESILPTEVYVKLQRQVHQASERHQWKFIILSLVISVTVLLIALVAIDFDPANSSSSYLKFACGAGFLLLGFLIWKLLMYWMNKSLHAQMERVVVHELQGMFMECGVQLGYYHEPNMCDETRSHMWLRRIPESQIERAVTTSSLMESSVHGGKEEELFPPIFIHWLVPGEIHINEKEYDPSMIVDQEVWTMIRDAHFGSFKPYNRYLAILMVALAILWLLYTSFIWLFMSLFGTLEAWLVYLGLLSGFVLTWFILDRLNVNAWSQVADDVTLLLLKSENPNLNGTALKFETSLLPFRNRRLSRRYQLVRVQGSTNPLDSSAVNHGKEVDYDEHQMV